MFPSKQRPLIISQYEHQRLVAHLALSWGNDEFDRPVLPWEPFLRGVAFHDWHYPRLDTLPIIGAPEEDWLSITRPGIAERWEDPVTDIVIKLHIKRLLSYNLSEERMALMDQIEEYVQIRAAEAGLERELFTWADHITGLCDNISFYFCFEAPRERDLEIASRQGNNETVTVKMNVIGDGRVEVSPWPFNVPFIEGTLVGYEAPGYPTKLQPVVVPYRIEQGSSPNQP